MMSVSANYDRLAEKQLSFPSFSGEWRYDARDGKEIFHATC
jgi:hypothetical protein